MKKFFRRLFYLLFFISIIIVVGSIFTKIYLDKMLEKKIIRLEKKKNLIVTFSQKNISFFPPGFSYQGLKLLKKDEKNKDNFLTIEAKNGVLFLPWKGFLAYPRVKWGFFSDDIKIIIKIINNKLKVNVFSLDSIGNINVFHYPRVKIRGDFRLRPFSSNNVIAGVFNLKIPQESGNLTYEVRKLDLKEIISVSPQISSFLKAKGILKGRGAFFWTSFSKGKAELYLKGTNTNLSILSKNFEKIKSFFPQFSSFKLKSLKIEDLEWDNQIISFGKPAKVILNFTQIEIRGSIDLGTQLFNLEVTLALPDNLLNNSFFSFSLFKSKNVKILIIGKYPALHFGITK